MKIAAFDEHDGQIVLVLNGDFRQVTMSRSEWMSIDENNIYKDGKIVNAATVNALLSWLERGGPLP